jgi:hypothetical protein
MFHVRLQPLEYKRACAAEEFHKTLLLVQYKSIDAIACGRPRHRRGWRLQPQFFKAPTPQQVVPTRRTLTYMLWFHTIRNRCVSPNAAGGMALRREVKYQVVNTVCWISSIRKARLGAVNVNSGAGIRLCLISGGTCLWWGWVEANGQTAVAVLI